MMVKMNGVANISEGVVVATPLPAKQLISSIRVKAVACPD